MSQRQPLNYRLLALIAAAATCWIGWRAVLAAQKPPRAVFTPLKADAGTLRVGDTRELHFTVENRGDQPLRLLSADGGCGCITTRFPTVIRPHRTGDLVARFEALQYWSGDQLKTVLVRTNDPGLPQAELTVIAHVTPAVAIEPNERVNLTYRGAAILHREVALIPEPGGDTRLRGASSSSPAVHAELVPPAAADKRRRYRLLLTIDTRKSEEDLAATVKVATTNPHVDFVSVYVTAQSLEGVLVQPREFKMKVGEGGQDGRDLGGVQIMERDRSVRILGAETGDARLTAGVVERSNCFWVMLRQRGLWQPGVIQGEAQVRTNDSRSPIIRIPYEITITKQRENE
jgi:hypothetical protein